MKYTDMNKQTIEKETAQNVVVGLNIICPECQLEGTIKSNLDSDEHFMTAMGGVIHHLDDRFRKEMHDMISINNVNTLRLIMNPDCSLLQNAIDLGKKELYEAEQLLRKIYYVHKEDLDQNIDDYTKRMELAKLNLILQGAYLKRNPFLDLKVGAGLLELKGVIYHPKDDVFEEIFTTGQ